MASRHTIIWCDKKKIEKTNIIEFIMYAYYTKGWKRMDCRLTHIYKRTTLVLVIFVKYIAYYGLLNKVFYLLQRR